jgi:serine/threonine-protein kinase
VADVLEQLRAALGDRYEVERLVGEGGMATVYLAEDRRHSRRVAIKTLRAELAASIGADRFLREIRVAASLQHPNVLGLYDSGEAGGILYYVMPFVEGESLRDRLNREQQLPLHDAVRITREAAEGLAYAHERGVVHRDIKPENIMLQNGHALVADFGIARALDVAGEKLTQTGMAVGTPHYMSPEQSLGADHADARSDIYSLGCVLYEVLAGQPPFDGPNSRAIMARHAMEQVPSIRIVRQTVPEELEDAVLQSLEKTPADRFQSMSEFADVLADLEPTVATRRTTSRGMPAVRRSTPTGSRTTRTSTPTAEVAAPRSKRGVKFWGLAGAALLVAAGLAVWRFGLGAKSADASSGLDPRRIAVLYLESQPGADSLNYLADGLTEALIRELSGVGELKVISSNGVQPYKEGKHSVIEISRALQVGSVVLGNVAQSGDRLRDNVSLIDAGDGTEIGSRTLERGRNEIFALQDDLAKEVSNFLRIQLGKEVALRENRAGTRDAAAWGLLQKAQEEARSADRLIPSGDTTAVYRLFAQADTLYGQAEQADPKWTAPIVQRGWLDYRQSRLAGSFDKSSYDVWTQRGLAHAERALTVDPADADALELRGTLRYWRWLLNLEPDGTRAAALFADAERDLRASVDKNPIQATAWTSLSHLLINKQEPAEAKLAALRAYEADPYLTNANQTLWRLFSTSVDLDDPVEARHWCEEGGRRFPQDSRFAECRVWVGFLKGQKPDVDSAWAQMARYVELSSPNQREFWQLRGQMIMAAVLARAGLKDSARAVILRSRADAPVDPARELAQWEAVARTILGDKDEAITQLGVWLATNPQQRATMAKDNLWWWKDLRGEERYRQLLGVSN